jgi:hypothetical protein
VFDVPVPGLIRVNTSEFSGSLTHNADGSERMRGLADSIAGALFVIVEYGIAPAVLLWGWVRWYKRPKPRTLFPILSFVGFVLATASAVVALLTVAYANSIGGFPHYDPRLMKIFRWASVLSLTASAFAIAGVWRPGPLRWHALACAIATLLFWFEAAMGE